MNKKLVSVCLPSYNSSGFIEETLNSLINQTYDNIEIIIGDNASSDNTCDIINEFQKKDSRIKYYINDINLGYSSNCNKLISLAKGEYVAIFHSDDIYDLKIIEKQVESLDTNIDLLGVFTMYNKISENGEFLENTKYPIISSEQLIRVSLSRYIDIILEQGGSCFCCPTSMIRKDVYDKLNGYDEGLEYIEDQDMWARILINGEMGIINEKLLKYRIHNKQVSSIYLDKKRTQISIPLKHIKKFIKDNSLDEIYNHKLLKAEAINCVTIAKFAVNNKNFNLFKEKIIESRRIYRLGYNTKHGIIQNIYSPIISYFIIKFWNIIR
jgi:glycosyltransferase involved in cell wall biosynthesis